ncbi:MAG: hypothetical protein O2958_10320 [Gemmatimonadetes bacterium]|nr:hypothetical protein [Gemmatimonadota bacterium]MDA1103393.1 hypothetical protein [Gemmatimonadota bacterium]
MEFSAADHGGSGPTQIPTWIEWDGAELVLYPTGATVNFSRDLSSITTFEATYAYVFDQVAGTPLGAELARVAMDSGRYIILLVRPSGFQTLPEITGYLGLLGIDVVAEPIDQNLRRIQVR